MCAQNHYYQGDINVPLPKRMYNENLICIQCPTGRIYLLQAESKTDANEWITAIRKTIQMLPKVPCQIHF
jgi:hypothetical protein